ncbi:glycosyltransferase family A protein [Myxacorys almedinensis]|uniref:Glycosyltransferase n=1 Tax=Myxacorys almedinensis A TaxID=2690445 RepID=A0A8J7Z2A3_9CYAN|nr:glycosyltransferase family A protein [Myxacorys almedinensis]NDJ18727.1 glycosyltransferase [Myxacorys almedinensis A]
MLVFIIPLRSKRVSKSWETVSNLLERTLLSVQNQTSSKFRTIVVCHERPTLKNTYSYLEYVDVDFSPPRSITRDAKNTDKYQKILAGLRYAYKDKNAYFMTLDSDDCVSNKLAQFVQENPDCNGWFFNTGYQYREGSKAIRLRKKNFHLICGTSNIVRGELLQPLIDQDEFLAINDKRFLQHHRLAIVMAERGSPLQPLPFPGAIYSTDNTENSMYQTHLFLKEIAGNPKELVRFYALRFYRLFVYKALIQQVCDEFGLYSVQCKTCNKLR